MVNYGNAAGLLDPSGDPSGATDQPRIAQAIASGDQLGLGTFYITGPLTPDTLQVLRGSGPGTIIKPGTLFSGTYMVKLAHPASTYQVTVQDLTLVPNTGTVGGVQLDNTGYTGGAGPTQQNDTLHTLTRVYVVNAGGDGFHLDNNIRSLRMEGCTVYGAGGHGVTVGVGCTDSSFVRNIVGVAAGHCWNITGWNNYFASCKGFFAGNSGGTFDQTHSCWAIGTNAAYNTFASCSGQNGGLHGWDLQSCNNNALVGCEADTNNQGGGTGVGINTNTTTYCAIIGCTGNNSAGAVNKQVYGVQVAGTQTNTSFIGCTVTGQTGPFGYVSGGGYFILDPDSVNLASANIATLAAPTQIGNSGAFMYSGSGAPNIAGAPAGSYYFRTDTPSTANQRIYVATGTNTWSGIV